MLCAVHRHLNLLLDVLELVYNALAIREHLRRILQYVVAHHGLKQLRDELAESHCTLRQLLLVSRLALAFRVLAAGAAAYLIQHIERIVLRARLSLREVRTHLVDHVDDNAADGVHIGLVRVENVLEDGN